MSRVGARKAVSPVKDLEELPHNMHHFVICSTPPVSSRGLLAQWTCITYRLRVIHFYNVTPFPGCVHPARSGAILRPRYTFLKKVSPKVTHIFWNYWTPCQCIEIRIRMEPSKPHNPQTPLASTLFHLTSPSPTSTMHPKISTLQTPHLPTQLVFIESDGVLPVRCQVVSTNTEWLREKKRGGYALTRVHLLHCLFLFYWNWALVWVVEFAPLNFKGSIWAIQMGKLEAEVAWTWTWILFAPFTAVWT